MSRSLVVLMLVLASAMAVFYGCSSSGGTSPETVVPWYTNATWTMLADFPPGSELGTCTVWAGGDYVYALRGGIDEHHGEYWRYQISTDIWEQQMDDTPFDAYWASSMVWTGGDYIFAIEGNGNDGFYRYTISTGGWDEMASFPEVAVRYTGQTLAWPGSGDYVYAVQGNNQNTFVRYQISADAWETLNPVPQKMYRGNSIAYGGNGRIFATTDSLGFYGYDRATGQWSNAADCPVEVDLGGWLCRDGNGSLFLTEGDGSSSLWRYDLGDDNWEEMLSAPGAVDGGGCIVSDGEALYVMLGDGSTEFWVLKE